MFFLCLNTPENYTITMNTFHIPEISSSNIQCNYLKKKSYPESCCDFYASEHTASLELSACLLDIVSLVCELAFASHLYPVRKMNRLQISR